MQFRHAPTSASWLNQVEGFFGIPGKQLLGVAHFPSKAALREHIDAYIGFAAADSWGCPSIPLWDITGWCHRVPPAISDGPP